MYQLHIHIIRRAGTLENPFSRIKGTIVLYPYPQKAQIYQHVDTLLVWYHITKLTIPFKILCCSIVVSSRLVRQEPRRQFINREFIIFLKAVTYER